MAEPVRVQPETPAPEPSGKGQMMDIAKLLLDEIDEDGEHAIGCRRESALIAVKRFGASIEQANRLYDVRLTEADLT